MLEKARWQSAAAPAGRAPALLLFVLVVLLIALSLLLRREGAPAGPPAKHHSQLPGDGLAPKAPNPWFFAERAFPTGHIPPEAVERMRQEAALLREEARAEALRGGRTALWTPRGPTNIGGRITDLAVDPRDANRVYAAAAEGGILRTDDAGQHWLPLFDEGPALAMGAVALDPANPDIVYAGGGEVNPGGGSVAYGGAGLFRSPDRGATWEPLGLETVGAIGRIRVDPTNSQRLFVAAMGQLWETDSARGVYRSIDGGDTWQQVLFVADDTGCVDLIQRPDQPNVLLAAMWQRLRQPEAYDYGGPRCAVYRSTNGGDTWTLLSGTGGLPAASSTGGRIGLDLCAADPNVMCAVFADRTGYFSGLWRSTNGGDTWTRTADSTISDVFASYGWWFGNVRVHPANAQTIWVLGLDFYRSTNGGSAWSEVSGGMHVDHHALAFGSGPSPVIYNGNDGGVYRSTNGGSAWSLLPDQPVAQVYRMALDAMNPNALVLGAQDNGTNRSTSGAANDFAMIYGGDGFGPLVHPTNSLRLWAQYQYGGLGYSSNGGGSFSGATSGIGGSDRIAWNAPLVQDPTNVDRRYFGTNKLYRSASNTSWTAVSGDLTGGPHAGNAGQVRGTLTAIAISPLDGQVLWTGSDDGYVNVSTNGGTNWTNVAATLPDRWVTSLHGDPFDRETAYVTISGFRWTEPLPHVFRTTDLGATWESIAGNLPEAPANDLIPDPATPGRLWLATDVGVYFTQDGGASWAMLGPDLPNVVVSQLAFDPVNRLLYAGTYGRSVFTCAVDELTAAPPAELAAAGRLLAPYPNPSAGGAWIAWSLAQRGEVELAVYSVAGRRVWSGRAAAGAGEGRLFWGGVDAQGERLPSGVYLARASAAGHTLGSAMITLRR